MDRDSAYFDRHGILPSPSVATLDDYLREAEAKLATMARVHSDPDRYFGSGSSIYHADGNLKAVFVQRFETEPLPNVLIEKKNIKKVMFKKSIGAGIAASLTLGNIGGSILGIEGMQFPYLDKDTRLDKADAALHESIHAFRSQWQTKKVDRKFMGFEEVIAYTSDQDAADAREIIPIFGLLYSVMSPVTGSWPVIAGGGIWMGISTASEYGVLAGISTGVVGALLYLGFAVGMELIDIMPKVSHYKRVYDQGKGEGLNMDYMILRTNSTEFSLSKPLEEQIAYKEGIRWDVIRGKCGIAKAGNIF
jgi:hypothetical protein